MRHLNIINLSQVNHALAIASVNAAQLAELGFRPLDNKAICESLPPEQTRQLRNAKLYAADSVPRIRQALAARLAQGLDMHAAGDTELARIWTKIDAIRAKQAAKPKHSPLPAAQEEQRYRLLKRGEAIEAADEFLCDDFSWRIDPKGIFCGEPWGHALRAARRAIAAQAAQGGV